MASGKQRKSKGKKELDFIRDDIYFEIGNLTSVPLNSLLNKASKRSKEAKRVPTVQARFNDKKIPKVESAIVFKEFTDGGERVSQEQAKALNRIWIWIADKCVSEKRIDEGIENYFQKFGDYHWSLFKMLNFGNCRKYKSKAKAHGQMYVEIYRNMFKVFQQLKPETETAPSQEVQLASFRLICRIKDEFLFREANSVFRYDSTPELFVEPVQRLVKEYKFELAARWISILQLHEQFNWFEIVFRLLLQNKVRLVIKHLEEMSEISRFDFVLFCDKFCQKRELNRYIKESQISKIGVTSPQQLAKSVDKLSVRIDVPFDRLPNVKKWRAMIAVNSLFHAQYDKNAFHEDDWEEFLRDTIEDDPQLQLEALRLAVYSFIDSGRAYTWLEKWGVQKSRLPKALVNNIESRKDDPFKKFNKSSKNNLFYQPHLKASNIINIDDANEYRRFIDALTDLNIVGLDIKGKPKFTSEEIVRTSIIQISTADRVYLLDIISLNSVLSRSEWELLHNQLFTNSSISKVVFSFDENWNYIEQICPEAFVSDPSESFIDLKKLSEDKCPDLFILPKILNIWNSDRFEDFSCVVHRYVDLPLDIREEKSNWEKRPLRKAQIQFAAVNAFCLLKVYVEMNLQ